MQIITKMDRRMVGEKAARYLGNGFHCAEAVATAVLETMGEIPWEAAAHATAFGGGSGRTHQEACGALSGALIAIGHLHGRRRLGGEWDLAAKLGTAIRQQFLDEYETAHCATLLNRFGDRRQMDECRKLTQRVTTALLALLTGNLQPSDRPDSR